MAADIYDINTDDFANKFIPHFLRDADFVIENGDFKIANTNEQESYYILQSHKGQYYQSPRLGAAILKYQNADVNKNELRKIIRTELRRDGFIVNNVYLVNSEDVVRMNITDPEILSKVEQDGFIIALDIDR
jgi:hypothetical protein